jgi:signal transduction histidine kinase
MITVHVLIPVIVLITVIVHRASCIANASMDIATRADKLYTRSCTLHFVQSVAIESIADVLREKLRGDKNSVESPVCGNTL